uniref:Uncharacterized protein n=1 Tax=Physcomitrium patens TaxID=3218 RepID=A0A2K1K5N5_PHYPA|nr:hypothetical protein PHYPA_010986 [Physcomitrium patens]
MSGSKPVMQCSGIFLRGESTQKLSLGIRAYWESRLTVLRPHNQYMNCLIAAARLLQNLPIQMYRQGFISSGQHHRKGNGIMSLFLVDGNYFQDDQFSTLLVWRMVLTSCFCAVLHIAETRVRGCTH